jgi:hypothetical protein
VNLHSIPLPEITGDTIKELLSVEPDTHLEGKLLDFKQELKLDTADERKEFLSDVCSFANASGGDLIIGVDKNYKVVGLHSGVNEDTYQQQLNNLLRDSMEPRLYPPDMKTVDVDGSKVLLIRIRKSWNGPHRVNFKGHVHFYSRTSTGKYPLDIGEIRSSFLGSDSLNHIRNYRAERIGNILAGETPVKLPNTPKIVMHSIPVDSFISGKSYDLPATVTQLEIRHNMAPVGHTGYSEPRFNFDGYMTSGTYDGTTSAYFQIFRDGCIETVDTYLLDPRPDPRYPDGKYIPSVAFEEAVAQALGRILHVQMGLGIAPPVFISLSLLGVRGYVMAVSAYYRHKVHQIEKDSLITPEIQLESFNGNPFEVLRPLFDSIWQAAGFERSIDYNEKGEWRPAR